MNPPERAPIALFVFNRPDHTRQTIEALRRNRGADGTRLYVFSDDARNEQDQSNVEAVRTQLRSIDGFKQVEVVLAGGNRGLARSIISGVSAVLSEHRRVIVVEDDLVTSDRFLDFMNDGLETYGARKDVFSISGYCHPARMFRLPRDYPHDVFLSLRNSTWGWATWLDRWQRVDWEVSDYASFRNCREKRKKFDRGGQDLSDSLDKQMAGLLDSWGIRFTYAHFANEAYSVVPVRSFVDNIGHDGSGVHCGKSGNYRTALGNSLSDWVLPKQIEPEESVLKAFRQIYTPSNWMRFKQMVRRALPVAGGN